MNKRTRISNAVAAAFLAASAQLAFAVDEVEPNDTAATAQQLVVGTDGPVVIQATIGVNEPNVPLIADVDYYTFEGSEGNAITIDIDGGMKAPGETGLNVDTRIALFKAGPTGQWEILLQVDNSLTVDEGSVTTGGGERDARIDEPPFALPADGRYLVGVISSPRFFKDDGTPEGELLPSGGGRAFPNGGYKLIISGVTPPARVQYVNIDIKPGDHREVTALNPKQKRDIPIALLSRRAKGSVPAFNPLDAKVDSITFGRGGNENSLVRCLKEHRDVNHDRMPDLICLFDVPSARFEEDDAIGKLKGETKTGVRFEAVGKLKVLHTRSRRDDDRPEYRPHHGWHHGHHHGHQHGRDDDRRGGKNYGHDRDDDKHHGGR
jgi:hypothetical protein